MRRLFYISLVLACYQCWSNPANAKQQVNGSFEKFRLLTDRSIYMVGEDIHFRVFNLSTHFIKDLEWSKVFYVELISPEGISHAGAKMALDSSGTSGSLKIPEDIPSGTYFMKGYTHWMRNDGPSKYAYLSIEVVNPFKKTVLKVDTVSDFQVPLLMHEDDSSAVGFFSEKKISGYARRSPVSLYLTFDQIDMPAQFCISVIREGILKKQRASSLTSNVPDWNQTGQLPETRGISLTGKIVDAQSGKPAPYAVVYISIMGEERDFFSNYTDSLGRFYFAFPESYGEKDLFISANHPDISEIELFIEQDFCPESIALPSYPIGTDPGSMALISDLSLNAQILDQYETAASGSNDSVRLQMKYFYGEPSTVVKFDDYIKLPTMEEYFTEVTPKVFLKKSNRKRSFHVLGNHPELNFFSPLVMIDGVAIFDEEAVLAISPRYVDRVEIVDAPYIRGNVTFGGIINIISVNGNMGFIDLPSSGLLVKYKMYHQAQAADQFQATQNPRIPDVRNTLYWNPDVEAYPGDKMEIEFYTADLSGTYQIVLRGYDSSGRYLEWSTPFNVE